tara:strand:- start:462 stop:1334 length:873 start_codon:yes stop_codon:yes gene_type:complete
MIGSQNQNTYYSTAASFGNYQFIKLENIIDNFMYIYVGENKIISKVNKIDVQFHAIRALQELSYDILKSFKSQEIEVPNTLTMTLPHDYVNYIKITRVGTDGIERVLYPTRKTSNPFAVTQDAAGVYQFTGDNITEQSPSNTLSNFDSQTTSNYELYDINSSSDVEISFKGRRYGLDPEHAQMNGSFFIDNLRGKIHFGSALSGETIILHYVSDGMGSEDEMVIHKFCEEACYKWIMHGVLSGRSNIPEYIVQRFKKERFAETRKAKIRLSNIKIEEFTQVLKGLSKQIK